MSLPSSDPAPASSEPAPAKAPPRSTLVSRNVTISNHRTSVRLEPEMWSGLSEICRREGGSLHEVCTAVANRKDQNTSLTAAIRVFVMAYYRSASTEEGHTRTGHGYGIATLIANLSGHRLATSTVTTAAPPAAASAVQTQRAQTSGLSPYGMRTFATSGTRNGFR